MPGVDRDSPDITIAGPTGPFVCARCRVDRGFFFRFGGVWVCASCWAHPGKARAVQGSGITGPVAATTEPEQSLHPPSDSPPP